MSMEIQRTIPIVTNEIPGLVDIVNEFTKFKREISAIAFNNGSPLRAIDLHHQTYHIISSTLPSQMKCSAIRSVASAYASAKSNGRPATHPFLFKKSSALFLWNKDFSFTGKGLLSIATTTGRVKVPFRIPSFAKTDFDSAVSYDSITVTGNGRISLCLTLNVPDPVGHIPVGIDLGATNALVASTDDKTIFISGCKQKVINQKTRKVRQRLQRKLAVRKAEKKDTHSVRRFLKRLGRKQYNRTKTFCAETAAKLCDQVPANAVLVFEDLRIKQPRKRKRRAGTNRKLSQWPYGTMIEACTRKAQRKGMAIAFIDPAYTSQQCRKCGQLGNRRGHNFTCSCGHSEHADINASHNIRLKFTVLRSSGLSVNQPRSPDSVRGQAQGFILG